MSTSEFDAKSQSGELDSHPSKGSLVHKSQLHTETEEYNINDDSDKSIQKGRISRQNTDEGHKYNEEESDSDSDNDYATSRQSRKRKRVIKDDDSDDSTDCDDIPVKKRIKLSNLSDSGSDDDLSDSSHTAPLQQNDYRAALNHIETCTHCKKMKLNWCDYLGYESLTPPDHNKHDWKLNPIKLKYAIKTINDKLNMRRLLPNIDCFASHQNYQSFKWFITIKDDFFSNQYNCKVFWSLVIAWKNPPFELDMFEKIMKTYKSREMRGYLCGPYWLEDIKQECNEWYNIARKDCVWEANIGGVDNWEMYFPASTQNMSGLKGCPFDTVILYFDFRDRKRKQYEKGDIIWVEYEDANNLDPAIVLSCEYDENDNERVYPSKYELLWLCYKDLNGDRKGLCSIEMESCENIKSYVNAHELTTLNICDEGPKEIKRYRPDVYSKYFD